MAEQTNSQNGLSLLVQNDAGKPDNVIDKPFEDSVKSEDVVKTDVARGPDDIAISVVPLTREEKYLSLGESNGSIAVPGPNAPYWKKLFAFSGLGFLVSVGYMDPGNWATALAGGSKFGYTLLCVVLISNFLAMFLQFLSLKLGVAAELDLAQACRAAYHPYVNYVLWVLAEIAICATDLAEVIGCSIALNLLLGIPLWAGVLITLADVMLLLLLQAKHFRVLEVIIGLLTAVIAVCFIYELASVKPNWLKVLRGLVPDPNIVTNPDMLYIAIGILGATVMPHNLYLHSSIIQTRAYPRDAEGKAMAIKYGTIDSTFSLLFAFFINASILILAGAAFYYGTGQEVEDLRDAYHLLTPAVGAKAASILFGVALLASGQNSTITGTLSGQIVMEGFLQLQMPPWLRRLLTRSLVAVPAALVAALLGGKKLTQLLVFSQVILSLQLTFAVAPLVHVTSTRKFMGKFTNAWWVVAFACLVTLFIAGLNVYLFIQLCIYGGPFKD